MDTPPRWSSLQKRSSISSERPFLQQQRRTSRDILDDKLYRRSSLRYSQTTKKPVPDAVVFKSSFEFRFPLYGLDWSFISGSPLARIALSSYKEESANPLRVVYGTPESGENGATGWSFREVSGTHVRYPVTRLQWDPAMKCGHSQVSRFATTSECLRIYEVNTEAPPTEDHHYSDRDLPQLEEKMCLTNAKARSFNHLPPLTSFDWNLLDPSRIITCSIDTTCSLWDVSRGAGVTKTQLIAHDSEVFDVKFVSGGKDIFTSCSNDGSVRVFDLRNLEHSTIIYEPQPRRPTMARAAASYSSSSSSSSSHSSTPSPGPADGNPSLVRLATSNYNANHIAVLEDGSNRILILDLRYPGLPLTILQQHSAAVNAIQWHPSKNLLLSGSDDCQALIWNMDTMDNYTYRSRTRQLHSSSPASLLPASGFATDLEVNNVCWDPLGGWVAVNTGKKMQTVRYSD